MSSATDPYQGCERRLRITRRALEAFERRPPRRLLIQTRSPLIERDTDLIAQLGDRAIASITLETDDDGVRRAITPTSPAVARRMTTMRRLRAAGIFTQMAIAPMLPNDPQRFASLAAEVADRVIVDTYFDGDGAGGRRSRARHRRVVRTARLCGMVPAGRRKRAARGDARAPRRGARALQPLRLHRSIGIIRQSGGCRTVTPGYQLYYLISSVVSAVGMLAAVATALIILRQARLIREQNQVSALIQLQQQWESPRLHSLRSTWAWAETDIEALEPILEFLEEFAGFKKRNLLTDELIWDTTIGWHAARYYLYNKTNGNIEKIRNGWRDDQIFQNLERELWPASLKSEGRSEESVRQELLDTKQKFLEGEKSLR